MFKFLFLQISSCCLVVFVDTLEQKPDVVALTETWLKESDKPDDFDLPGDQKLVSKPRKQR